MIVARRLSMLGALLVAALVALLSTAVRAETPADEVKAKASSWKTAPEVSLGQSAMRMTQGLAACLALIAFGVVVYRRLHEKKGPGAMRRMRITERLSLSGKTTLCLFEVDGVEYLATVGSEQVSMQPIEQHLDLKKAEWDEVCGTVSAQAS